MIEFRRRHMGRYQIPINYVWYDELVAGALGPEVPINGPGRARADAGGARSERGRLRPPPGPVVPADLAGALGQNA